jgi:preprotein translocase subunit SecG
MLHGGGGGGGGVGHDVSKQFDSDTINNFLLKICSFFFIFWGFCLLPFC